MPKIKLNFAEQQAADRITELEATKESLMDQLRSAPSYLDVISSDEGFEGKTGDEAGNALIAMQQSVAGQISDAEKEIVTHMVTKNQGALTALKDEIRDSIHLIVEEKNPEYQELIANSDDKIHTLVFTITEAAEGSINGDLITLNINPQKTRGRKVGNGGARGAVSNKLVTRTNSDGATETMTVKEVCERFATQDVRDSSSWEKRYWKKIFEDINPGLGFTFVNATTPKTEGEEPSDK